MNTIIYYAASGSMGDISNQDCNNYRDWAMSQLDREYPDYQITVSSELSLEIVYTDDEKNRDQIIDFCSRLWDNCPWD